MNQEDFPDISEVLLRGGTEINEERRREAENRISALLLENFPFALLTLTNEIFQESKNPVSRRIAGAVFKNALSAKNLEERFTKEEAWLKIDPQERTKMKTRLVQTLASSSRDAVTAAVAVISRIAQIELPHNQWDELIQILLENMANPAVDPQIKVNSLKTLGFICEDIAPEALESSSDKILTAIISGMRRETQNVEIILAACDSFLNCLRFIRKNFEVIDERNVIMGTLSDTAAIDHPAIQTKSLMCLVEIADLYYHTLSPYMDKIFNLTMAGIKGGDAEVACQAIEFWSTVCDKEFDLDEEGGDSLKLIEKALPYILPPLLDSYHKRDYDDDDEDSLNVAIAASRCVANVALVVRDQIVDHVLPVIQLNITQNEWEKKDSATLLFADILEGPSEEKLLPSINGILPVLADQLKHESVHLKDTTLWTIAKICQLHHTLIRDHVSFFLETLHPHFQDPPAIAVHCCFAVANIAEAFEDDAEENTSPMSKYFFHLISELMSVAYRTDGSEIGLRSVAFEAITVVIQNGAKDTNESLLKTVPPFLEKLQETFSMQVVSNDDRERQIELQGYLCTLLSQITQKLGRGIFPFHQKMMELFLNIFKFHANSSRASIHEDVLMVLGSVVCVIEGEFRHFLPQFFPFILQAMKCTQESSLIKNCVGLISDLAGALKKEFTPCCREGIIDLLFLALKDDSLDRNVKPLIISCFGDIANGIGENFSEYLMRVIQVLSAAADTPRGAPEDEGFQEFLVNLRASIFDAYTGIIQGLRQDNKGSLFEGRYCACMMSFIDRLAAEKKSLGDARDPGRAQVLNGMIGVIGDFAELGGPETTMALNRQSVVDVLREASTHPDQKIRKLGEWANRVVTKLVSNR